MDKKQANFIKSVIEDVDDMTIATVREDGFPQATTVSFVSDGMTIFFGTSADSQKAQNIERNNKVSLTIDAEYEGWEAIRSLSMGALASRVEDPKEIEKVGKLLVKKFPEAENYVPDDTFELAFYRVDPKVISLIDYSIEFGHTEQVMV
jgi:general stress protein 26